MAESLNPKLQGTRGAVGKQLVFKKYGDKTVITKYPDMKGIVPSEAQKENQSLFRKAIAYASSIHRDPQKNAEYQKMIPQGEDVYHYALKEYLARFKSASTQGE